MTDEAWVLGIGDLVLAFSGADVPPDMLKAKGEVYRRHLDHLSDEDWLRAVAMAVRSEKWFPSIASLVEYAAPVGPQLPEAAAVAVYEEIADAFEDGFPMTAERVKEKHGEVVRQAFLAAGGYEVFVWCDKGIGMDMRRKRFVEAFVRARDLVPSKQIGPVEARRLLKGVK